jgi:predicted unusual protein kinase regulating ubiquinone biosynthesis (AarF/ABC1/UbiB family)
MTKSNSVFKFCWLCLIFLIEQAVVAVRGGRGCGIKTYSSARTPAFISSKSAIVNRCLVRPREDSTESSLGKLYVVSDERETQKKSSSKAKRTTIINGSTNDDDDDDDHAILQVPSTASSSLTKETTEGSIDDDIISLLEEINTRVANGTAMIFDTISKELSSNVPEEYTSEIARYLEEMGKQIYNVQEQERQRQLAEFDKLITRPLSDIAFSDVPLYTKPNPNSKSDDENNSTKLNRRQLREELVLYGANSTLVGKSKKMKTAEILSNLDVAPVFFTVTLLVRWARKSTAVPKTYVLRIAKAFASIIKSKTKQRRPNPISALFASKSTAAATSKATSTSDAKLSPSTQETTDIALSGDALQAGWKRTGEIAAKGSFGKRLAILRRSAEIWAYFSSFYLRDKRITSMYAKGKYTEEQFKLERSKLGKEITQNLLKLGPTFIKVGQLFSTRIDIVPKEYIDELKELQDNVPGFSGDVAVRIIEQELGKPINELFDYFNTTSLAAASLGQVHVAHKGDQKMVIKVQRQYLRELFEVDLGQLRQVAKFADALDLQAEGGLLDRNTKRDWLSVFEENKRLLYEEIDYINEMKNANKFATNFQSSPKFRNMIRVPKVYSEYTTNKVLALEYLPGIKVTNKQGIIDAGLDPVDISVKMAESFLEQLCRHGFFHSDPHPGNVAVEKNPQTGEARIIFYDFGMMDSFDETKRKGLVDFFFALYYDANARDACNALERLGMLRQGRDIDRVAVERVGQDFIDRFQSTLQQNVEWENEIPEEERKRILRERRRQLGEEFMSLNRDSPFIFPATWTFVFRAFFTIDGIGKSLNSKYDLTKLTLPYLKELIDLKDGNAIKTTVLRIGKRVGLRPVDINQAVTQPRRTANIEDIVARLEKGDFKLRVRALEVERQLERTKLVQSSTFQAIISCLLLQTALVVLSSSTAGIIPTPSFIKNPTLVSRTIGRALLAVASFVMIRIPLDMMKINALDKYNERYGVK